MQRPPFLETVRRLYSFDTEIQDFRLFGDGHIHQTFLISTATQPYILQRFNIEVFEYPERISHNHAIMLCEIDRDTLPFILPLPVANTRGELFSFIDGAWFRLSPFVPGTCVNEVKSTHQAYLAARAFARLIEAGMHIPASTFQEPIPGFHDLDLRYQQFSQAVAETQRSVSGDLKELVDFYAEQGTLIDEYVSWKNRLPRRMTHNDTKINNLIYAEDGSEVAAVIDLDTIMAGYVMYDFGDLVRTVACTESESSVNWAHIRVDQDRYDALMQGFQDVGQGVFTPEELESLPFGGKMMTCIMGLRFLTDYLKGNVYYHIRYEQQNLHRAKNQMHLLMALL
ncbi:MAG: aminoglycoside phosphotransferase family protein [Spirochaetaceae bacterium]|nr:MAG: aminoglycoside phosphotransferase family protein [Spirochaetaceae bacterium]